MEIKAHEKEYQDKKAKRFADILFSVLFFNIFSIDELYEIVLEDRLISL